MAVHRWDEVLNTQSTANAPIKNTASSNPKDGWYPAFSATGQDVWLPEYRYEGHGIVVSAVGARCGKAFRADGKWNVVANTHALYVNEELALRDYCWYALNNEDWWIKAGSGQPFVKLKDSLRREHSFPPLEQQRKIVDILTNIDNLVLLRKEQIAKLDELVKARFVEMFGDPVENDFRWQTKSLDGICKTIVDCPHSTPSYTNKNTGFMCIRTSIVKKNRILWDDIEYIPEHEYYKRIQRKRPEKGDIVYTREGAILGIAAMIDRDCNVALGQRSMLLSPDTTKCLPQFLSVAMNFETFLRKALGGISGSASPHINVGDIKVFDIILPPLELQKQFVDFAEQTEKTKLTIQASLDKLEVMKKALMQEYFG